MNIRYSSQLHDKICPKAKFLVEVYWVIIALRIKHRVFFPCAVSIVAGNVWEDEVSKLKAKVVSSSGSKSTGFDQGMRTVAARSLG